MRTAKIALALTTACSASAFAATPVDGTIDTSFGLFSSGRNLIAFDQSVAVPLDIGRAAVADPSGRTYVVGTVQTDDGQRIGITRLLPNGLVDLDYGTDGKVVGPANVTVSGVSAALDAQGFLMVGGTRTQAGGNTDFAVCRFNTNGGLAAFPGNPQSLACITVAFDIGGTDADSLKDIAVQADGKIVLVGNAGFSSTLVQAALARLNTNGTLDSGFGFGGRQLFMAEGFTVHDLNAVAIASSGKIVVVGAVQAGANDRDGLWARLTTAGVLDNSFDTDGVNVAGLGGSSDNFFNDVVVDPVTPGTDSWIYAIGASETAFDSSRYYGWVKYITPAGASTAFFGAGGDLLVNGGHSLVYSVGHAQTDGKLVLAGTRTATAIADSDFRVTRIFGEINGGGLDAPGFNSPTGQIDIDILQTDKQDTGYALAVLPNRLVVVGTSLTSTPPANLDFSVAALRLDGIFANDFAN